jgi:hypothetical protein
LLPKFVVAQYICRWDYVVKHKVQLPDEYDSLHASIAPLWGIRPQYLQERRQEWENQGEIEGFTLGKLKPDDPVTLQKLIPAKNGDERNAYRRASMQYVDLNMFRLSSDIHQIVDSP